MVPGREDDAATEADVPLGMINGTVRPDSSRLRSPTRQFLRSTYARLDSAGVVGQADADALEILGVDPTRIRITGDAAFDQALATVEAARDSGTAVLPACSAGRVRLLGGSTWPPDEAVLLKVAQQIGSRLDLVLVPHEPSPAALDRIADQLAEQLRWGIRAVYVCHVDAVHERRLGTRSILQQGGLPRCELDRVGSRGDDRVDGRRHVFDSAEKTRRVEDAVVDRDVEAFSVRPEQASEASLHAPAPAAAFSTVAAP